MKVKGSAAAVRTRGWRAAARGVEGASVLVCCGSGRRRFTVRGAARRPPAASGALALAAAAAAVDVQLRKRQQIATAAAAAALLDGRRDGDPALPVWPRARRGVDADGAVGRPVGAGRRPRQPVDSDHPRRLQPLLRAHVAPRAPAPLLQSEALKLAELRLEACVGVDPRPRAAEVREGVVVRHVVARHEVAGDDGGRARDAAGAVDEDVAWGVRFGVGGGS